MLSASLGANLGISGPPKDPSVGSIVALSQPDGQHSVRELASYIQSGILLIIRGFALIRPGGLASIR